MPNKEVNMTTANSLQYSLYAHFAKLGHLFPVQITLSLKSQSLQNLNDLSFWFDAKVMSINAHSTFNIKVLVGCDPLVIVLSK